MITPVKGFGETAKALSRNPLGIIALFLVLIYGVAGLVVGFSGQLTNGERMPLVWFLVLFPPLVLLVFAWLVGFRHTNLYAPSDFRNEELFGQVAMRQYRATIALTAATTTPKTSESGDRIEPSRLDPKAIAQVVGRVGDRVSGRTAQWPLGIPLQKVVLWVDDRPDNNVFERQALEEFGVHFVLSTSTEEALEEAKRYQFDAIISDMGRPGDQRAGYTLLQKLRQAGEETPFIIYAGSRAPEHIAEAREKGAFGTTNRPDELFEMVLKATGLK